MANSSSGFSYKKRRHEEDNTKQRTAQFLAFGGRAHKSFLSNQ